MRAIPVHRFRALAAALLLLAVGSSPALARRLDVELWTDRGDDAVYREGDAMRIKVRATDDAYLLVYEIDTEGRVNLLYPWKRGSGRVEGRHTLRLPDDVSDYQLVVGRETGEGFIVAVASDRPFRELPWFLRPFDPQAASVGYDDDSESADRDEEGFDDRGNVVGDPYVAMERIRRRVLQDASEEDAFASAYTTYYVHEQVRYPRYLCNDCHRPNNWAWWPGFDPYYAQCSVFDFRVNWNWCWGPQIWTAYVPYYYYTVRTNCPPRFQPWAVNRSRFSSWDGWHRWNDLWGGDLRRYKPGQAPVGYTPPSPGGTRWKNGETPPGFVPPDVRRQGSMPGGRPAGWLARDRGDGRPVWRDGGTEGPRVRPDSPRERPDAPRWRPDGGATTPPRRGGDEPANRGRMWRGDFPRGGSSPAPREEPSGGSQGGSRDDGDRIERPRGTAPSTPWLRPNPEPRRPDPPRQEPQRRDPPRGDPVYKQPPPSDPQRSSPPRERPEGQRGRGGRGGEKG